MTAGSNGANGAGHSGLNGSGGVEGKKKKIRDAINGAVPAGGSGEKPDESALKGGPPEHLLKKFAMRENGLYRKGDEGNGIWLAGPFSVEAETRSADGAGWGILIAWADRDGVKHEQVFFRSAFAGECGELRQCLADGGLSLNGAGSARQAFAEFLNLMQTPRRAWSVARIGWHEFAGRRVFVLGDRTFGDAGARVVLQQTDREPSPFQSGGTLDDWRSRVSRLCSGNSRLLLAASAGFAAPLLGLLGEDGGGFHFRGASRLGKSTALRAAASVAGGTPGEGAGGFIRQWRATGNALEAVAGAHCDSLLCLDELGQVDGREAGEVAYMLANGAGKARAGRTGQTRPTLRFRVLFLSTGEVNLADKNAEAGKATKAGQEVRLIDIPAEANAGLGLFEDLHSEVRAADFAELLREATRDCYGTALPAFLAVLARRLATGHGAFVDGLRERRAVLIGQWLAAIPGAGGQVRSVANRFALVAVAGELATEELITEWQPGAAARAAEACFRAWLADRGTSGAREDAQAVTQLRNFIAKHGSARFETWLDSPQANAPQEATDSELPPPERFRVVQRAGWKRWSKHDGESRCWTFLMTSEGLKEALGGLAFKEAVKTLVELGLIVPSRVPSDTKAKVTAGLHNVPGHGKVRLYEIGAELLGGRDDQA